MSTNLKSKIYVFTERQLKEHDLNLAKIVRDATTKNVARKMIKMNSGQQLKSMTNDCKNLKLADSTLEKLSDLLLEEENKKR